MNNQKLIYVCSPLRGDVDRNIAKAKAHCRSVITAGHIPFAPHVALHGVLDDNIPKERETALACGLEMLKRCDEIWVFGRSISEGMAGEIECAKKLNMTIREYLF